MKTLFETFLEAVPKKKSVKKEFVLTGFEKKGAKATLFFGSIASGRNPPYYVAFEKQSTGAVVFSIGFNIPEKIPSDAEGWSLYFGLQDATNSNALAEVIYDGELWGLTFNRFSHDGLNGPSIELSKDLERAISEADKKAIDATVKKQALGYLKQVNELLERDAAGKLMYELVPTIMVRAK